MRIKNLTIKNFKNLRDFTVKFDTESPTTVLVGRNGTSKSNLLEVLTIIFRDLDLGEGPTIAYHMVYECNNHKVNIMTFPDEPRKKAVITVDGQGMTYKQLSKKKDYLPNFVFGYYSGPSNRMEEHFDKHQDLFYRDLLDGVDKPLRRLFYARLVHSQFVLLAFFLEQDNSIRDFLKDYLRIEGLDSVLFVMRQPPWARKKEPLKFWGARGVVQGLLNKLFEISLAPLQLTHKVPLEFGKSQTLQHLYLYLKDVERLRELASGYSNQQEFFKALESTYISKLISEVRIRVKARNIDGVLTFRELSEGEQQLLMVLGLLRFTREDESLFLLDEPDTHLNPAWSLQYLEMLKQVVGNQENSHIILATHDPLVITNLERQQVRLLYFDDKNKICSMPPEEELQGMGANALLESEIFGLRSTLGSKMLDKIDRRNKLFFKDKRTKEEDHELANLSAELSKIGLLTSYRDPVYKAYAKAYSRRQKKLKQVFSREELEHQEDIADEILDEIYEEDDS